MSGTFFNPYLGVTRTRPLPNLEVEVLVTEGKLLNEKGRDEAFSSNYEKMEMVPDSLITKSLISLYSWDDMKKISVMDVTKTDDVGNYTIWDPKMGPSTPLEVCVYCGQYDCPGHFGLVNFRRPVYNPVYIRTVVSVLRCVCRKCGKLLIDSDLLKERNLSITYDDNAFSDEEKKGLETLLKLMAGKRLIDFKYEERLKLMEMYCQKKKICNQEDCNVENYTYMVKNVFLEGEIKKTTKKKEDKSKTVDKGAVIPIAEIYETLNKISAEDAYLLGFTETNDDVIIRIINDIFYEVSKNIKFFNTNFSKEIINLLNNEIIISEDWSKLLDDIKKYLDSIIFDNLEFSSTELNDLIKEELAEYQIELKDRIITQYEVPSIIRRKVAEFQEKIENIIDNLIIEIGGIINENENENDISVIITDIVKNFPSKVEDLTQRRIIKSNNTKIVDLIVDQLSLKIDNYNDEIKLLIEDERKYNISRINSLLFSSHPRDLIMKGILVIPRIARPRVFRKGIYSHSSISAFYLKIIKNLELISEIETEIRTGIQSPKIKKRRTKGKRNKRPKNPDQDLAYSLKNLYVHIRNLIFEKKYDKAYPKKDKVEPLSIYQLIQGKTALIRHGMMGKIVSYCGRTVAGPDPSLKFGEIRIPRVWAPILTKRITVTSFNKEYLTKLMSNDNFEERKITHITKKDKGIMKKVKNMKYNLKIGDIVSRWLENGDRITVNRQPTLQKQSMMKYVVVLGKELTIGLHLSYTTPMNADFDGDELNAWDPQDFEVEAESEIIMDVKNNIMSVGQNKPSMGLVMNSVTASYLISKLNYIVNPTVFEDLFNLITPKKSINSLKTRLKEYGINPFSGDAILSALLPPDFYYNQKGVLIINGILISGRLRKSSVGASSRSIIQELYKNKGKIITSNFFTDAAWILNKWIMERGFSVGLLDMINLYLDKKTGQEEDKNLKVLKVELANIYNQLETLATKLDDPIEESFRQKQITNLSNVTTGIGIKLADDALTPDNSIAVMTEKGAGTKGAVANIGQMMGAVGQQFLYGERMPMSITGGTRALPTYDSNDSNPEAHGFIPTSFFTGLSPESLFFLQAGGRPSLLDTALKTQDTGSLQHKMIKAFENIIIANDSSIRNSLGYIFTPIYNGGYDTAEMLMIDDKTEFSSFIDIKSLADELNLENGWIPEHVQSYISKSKSKNDKIKNDILPSDLIPKSLIPKKQIDYTLEDPNPNIINYFELSRTIGARAKQLENNAKPLVDIGDEIDFVNIAMMEFEDKLLDRSFDVPSPEKLLSTFGFDENSSFAGYTLKTADATISTVKNYKEYQYNIKLVFTGKRVWNDLLEDLQKIFDEKHIIKGKNYSYISVIDHIKSGDAHKEGRNIIINLIGHSYNNTDNDIDIIEKYSDGSFKRIIL